MYPWIIAFIIPYFQWHWVVVYFPSVSPPLRSFWEQEQVLCVPIVRIPSTQHIPSTHICFHVGPPQPHSILSYHGVCPQYIADEHENEWLVWQFLRKPEVETTEVFHMSDRENSDILKWEWKQMGELVSR